MKTSLKSLSHLVLVLASSLSFASGLRQRPVRDNVASIELRTLESIQKYDFSKMSDDFLALHQAIDEKIARTQDRRKKMTEEIVAKGAESLPMAEAYLRNSNMDLQSTEALQVVMQNNFARTNRKENFRYGLSGVSAAVSAYTGLAGLFIKKTFDQKGGFVSMAFVSTLFAGGALKAYLSGDQYSDVLEQYEAVQEKLDILREEQISSVLQARSLVQTMGGDPGTALDSVEIN